MSTAVAHPNIALVKYWGKRDRELNLPSVGSLSLTLDRFETRTRVDFGVEVDTAIINGRTVHGEAASRIFDHLDLVVPRRRPAQVVSENNFPTAAGLASSSSAFAALTVAAAADAGLDLTSRQLSALARRGSGSACRSLWGGFVEWRPGMAHDGSDSHGVPLAPPDHWDVAMVVVIVDSGKKSIGSRDAMIRTQTTSPMYKAWVTSYDRDLRQARQAVLDLDLEKLGTAMERSTWKMHSTALTADPSIRYIRSTSLAVIEQVEHMRSKGIGAWWTMDAGPNVKVLCEREDAENVANRLRALVPTVEVLSVGGPPTVE
jgi:diphosphomevalonate decarboxylase